MDPALQDEASDPNTPTERLRELYALSPLLHTALSKNPATPTDLLKALSSNPSQIIRENITENPNTTKNVLFHLGTQFPAKLLKNAAFPLLFLENPNALEDFPAQLLLKLIEQEGAPLQLLAWCAASKNRDIRRKVASNTRAPNKIMMLLAGDHEQSVRDSLYKNKSAGAVLDFYHRAGASLDLKTAVQPDLTLSPELLAELASGAGFARYLAARHPNTSSDSLAVIARSASNDTVTRLEIAQHPNASAGVLQVLLEDAEPAVRTAATKHPNAPKEHIAFLRRLGANEGLSGYESPDLSLTEAELERLEEHCSHWVRLIIARHPKLSAALFAKLMSMPNREIHLSLAQNPSTPNTILEQFATVLYPYDHNILSVTAVHPNLSEKTLRSLWNQHQSSAELRRLIVQNPNTKGNILEYALLWVNDRRLRQIASRHPNAPPELLRLLRKAGATDDLEGYTTPKEPLSQEELLSLIALGGFAKSLAARHPNLSDEALRQFAGSKEDWVQIATASHPALPLELQKELAGSSKMWVREAIADNPNTNPEILATLSKDTEDVVRWAVAKNKNLPPHEQRLLTHDPNEKVRAAALRALQR